MTQRIDDEHEQGSGLNRRHFVRGLAGLGAVGAAGIASADPAGAADGDALLLGEENVATSTSSLAHTVTGETQGQFGLMVTSNGQAALAVASEVSDENSFVQAALWADIRSDRPGDAAIKADAKNNFAIEARNTSPNLPTIAGSNAGTGAGIGGMSEGGGPQLYLETSGPDGPVGPPTAGQQSIGGIRLDVNGDLWVCVEDGTPGTWTRLLREDQAPGRTIPITPIRALDTRAAGGRAPGAPAVPGQRKGPLKGGQSVTLDLAGVAPIPATASGVVGNATALTPSGNGFLRILPAGASVPASSFNFTAGTTIANGFTSALSATGLRAVAPISAGITYHLVIDIAAYIT